MSEPYLIAHLVRGQPAFDIAEKTMISEEEAWIIPTSGHRARPYWFIEFNKLSQRVDLSDGHHMYQHLDRLVPPCPKDWLDHYPCNTSPAAKGSDLDLEELGLL